MTILVFVLLREFGLEYVDIDCMLNVLVLFYVVLTPDVSLQKKVIIRIGME